MEWVLLNDIFGCGCGFGICFGLGLFWIGFGLEGFNWFGYGMIILDMVALSSVKFGLFWLS